MKTCSKCGCEKPNKDFNFKPGTADGKHSQCQECRNADRRAQREAKKVVVPMLTGTNPFDWRNYQQPMPMKASKWEQEP